MLVVGPVPTTTGDRTMTRLLLATGLMLSVAACAQTMEAPAPDLAASAMASTMTDAAGPLRDPYYGRHTTADVWGNVVPAPGEATRHGGSTTQSLGVLPPGSFDGGA
jgi:hypothetical protein